ncbi:hypothetical protein B4U80_10629 [Leptotrombidium deliense]|uniref:Uncharacterized protein n=1 Tax=Leptotrombidium deliense TaxID=299467 RepID=A0A443RZ70_9ACAR|nr:hypothetical protein B4U80_10629 [Leptotrombidium deliense]
MCEPEVSAVVFGNGSGLFKAGFSGNDVPKYLFLSFVGYPQHQLVMEGYDHKDFYVGNDDQHKRDIVKLSYPIERVSLPIGMP